MTVAQGLKVSYRKGLPYAAYLYLPRDGGARVAYSKRFDYGIIADFAGDDSCIGLELTAPGSLTLAAVNAVLHEVGGAPVKADELRPLIGSSAA